MAINKTINKRTNTHGAMRNCIEYVLRQDKTNELFSTHQRTKGGDNHKLYRYGKCVRGIQALLRRGGRADHA